MYHVCRMSQHLQCNVTSISLHLVRVGYLFLMELPSLFGQFLAALQPYKSSCPRWRREKKCKNIFQLFSLVMKTKLVQNVNRMLERHAKRQTDRQTDRQIEDKTTFQPSYQNKSCSECQQDVRKIERQADRQTDRHTDRKTDRLFSLVIKTKVFQNVNRMSKRQSGRKIYRAPGRQRDRKTVWQIAGQPKSPLLFLPQPHLLTLEFIELVPS